MPKKQSFKDKSSLK